MEESKEFDEEFEEEFLKLTQEISLTSYGSEKIQMYYPTKKLTDIVGLNGPVDILMQNYVMPLLFPQFTNLVSNSTMLVFGDHGAGKTHLLDSLAGQMKICVVSLDLEELVNEPILHPYRIVASLFGIALKNRPALIVIKNIEGFNFDFSVKGVKEMYGQAFHYLINGTRQFSRTENLYIAATSTRPWQLHHLLRRRFARKIYVHPLNVVDRKKLLVQLIPFHSLGDSELEELASATEDYTRQDLVSLVQKAKQLSILQFSLLHRSEFLALTYADCMGALSWIIPSSSQVSFELCKNFW